MVQARGQPIWTRIRRSSVSSWTTVRGPVASPRPRSRPQTSLSELQQFIIPVLGSNRFVSTKQVVAQCNNLIVNKLRLDRATTRCGAGQSGVRPPLICRHPVCPTYTARRYCLFEQLFNNAFYMFSLRLFVGIVQQ